MVAAVVCLAGSVSVGVLAALTNDQQTLLICTLISALLGPIAVALVTNRNSRRLGDRVDAVHHEIRPPSNHTTAGAQVEFVSSWVPWLYEELVAIGQRLGMSPHAPPPQLPMAEPPKRPENRRKSQ